MSLVDLVVGIVVVTILVTVMVGVVTYVAYKLRMAREPESPWEEEETRYFVRYEPGDVAPGEGRTADVAADGAAHAGADAAPATSGGGDGTGPGASDIDDGGRP